MSDTPKHDDMEVRHVPAAAGLDVRKMRVTATVRTHAGGEGPVSKPASSAHWRAASPFWCSGCSACG